MKRLGVLAFVLTATCLAAVAQNRDTAKELIATEQRFVDALLRTDWKTVDQLYADDLVFTDAEGTVTRKQDGVGSIRSGNLKFESRKISELKVQDFGDVGVVTGKIIERGQYQTTDLSGTYRFTDVWARRNGRWRLVAGQETLCKPAR